MILARARQHLLALKTDDAQPVRFQDIIASLGLGAEDPFTEKVLELRALAHRIKSQNEANRAFAKSGHGLVSSLVHIVDVFRVRRPALAPNGHMRRSVLDHVPRGVQSCSA